MKKVIGLSGSPRKKGNTDLIVNKILSGAKEKGAETKQINLAELKLRGCQACMYCKSNAGCAVKDDMQSLIKDLIEADTIVIGSPIYFWQMTAQTKAFIDRLFAFFMSPLSPKIKGKECVLAFSCGSPDGTFDSYIDSTGKMLEFFGLKVKDTISVGNANNGISTNTEFLEKAYDLGRSLA